MASIIAEGGVFNFKVVGKNKYGNVVAISDATVAADPTTLGAVSVGPDGNGGKFQSDVGNFGDVTLTATAAGVTSAPFTLTITADQAVVTVEITPVSDVIIEPT